MRGEKRQSKTVSDRDAKRQKLDAKQVSFVTFQSIIDQIDDLEDSGRTIVDLFLELPAKKDYPDYYDMIEDPISLHEIRNKVEKQVYTSSDEFLADFELMAANAATYNQEDSFVARDANNIYDFVRDQLDAAEDDGDDEPAEGDGVAYVNALKSLGGNLLIELIKYKVRGRVLSEIFMDEPPKDVYPEYYQVIPNATSFNTVRSKLEDGEYTTFDSFKEAVDLIFSNAKLFNEETSQVYVDADALQDLFDSKVEKLKQALPSEPTPSGSLKLKLKPQGKPVGKPQKIRLSLRSTRDGEVKDEEDAQSDEANDDLKQEEDQDGDENEDEGDEDEEDDDEEDEEEEDEEQELAPVQTYRRAAGKTAKDALIKAVQISSTIPVTSRYMQSKNPLPAPNFTDVFQVVASASNRHYLESYSFSVAPFHMLISFSAVLHESLHSRYHQVSLVHQGHQLAPLSSTVTNPWADNSKPLKSRFDVRLHPGLNHLVFTIHASPVREQGPPVRHTALNPDALLRSDGSEFEQMIFWINMAK